MTIVGAIYAGVLGQFNDVHTIPLFPSSPSPALADMADDKLLVQFAVQGPILLRSATGELFRTDRRGQIRFASAAAPMLSHSNATSVSAFACLCSNTVGCRSFPAVDYTVRSVWDTQGTSGVRQMVRVTSSTYLSDCRQAAARSLQSPAFTNYSLAQGMGLDNGITYWEPTEFSVVKDRINLVLYSVSLSLSAFAIISAIALILFLNSHFCYFE